MPAPVTARWPAPRSLKVHSTSISLAEDCLKWSVGPSGGCCARGSAFPFSILCATWRGKGQTCCIPRKYGFLHTACIPHSRVRQIDTLEKLTRRRQAGLLHLLPIPSPSNPPILQSLSEVCHNQRDLGGRRTEFLALGSRRAKWCATQQGVEFIGLTKIQGPSSGQSRGFVICFSQVRTLCLDQP